MNRLTQLQSRVEELEIAVENIQTTCDTLYTREQMVEMFVKGGIWILDEMKGDK